MVNYQNGKIYKIISNLTDKIYIGSTTKDTLAQRLTKHRSHYKDYTNGKGTYVSSFELLKLDHFQIILLERYPCKSRDELNAREQYHIDQNKDGCVNLQRAFTGINKEDIKEYKKQYAAEFQSDYKKQYYEENQNDLKIKARQYYNDNKEHVLQREKEYRQNNKDQIKERKKQYREEHKKEIQEKKSQTFNCECGSTLTIAHKSRHEKSLKHIHYEKNQWDNLQPLI